ncbi:hypothetical protein BDB00DRAFT_810025 [Zychaea mexicana]|uniref:uncharacterized protein n=1 Tax=Zychaea mexicana TaxID=64656 RepID=UPI0022FE0BC8|nr:uncharacterized protein BDB00DRAFT_810025 [Zychaea mexicana]KAI9496342.1 hypothetical protein BDB00DRAFT_810025 [Zychaea mexicana]
MDSQGRSILSSYESTEHALLDSFKTAANKVTALYRDSLTQNRRAFGAGYQQAFQDLYGFLSTHANDERDTMPVEDILSFLRQKSAQLAEELGESPVTVPRAQTTATTTTTQTTTTTSNQQDHGELLKQQQIHTEAQQQQHPIFSTQIIPSTPAGFQIDPNTQFTFTPPAATGTVPLPRYGGLSTWGSDTYQHENHGDAMKRRYGGSDLTFMGRPLSNMNVDSMEPSLKRGRTKREDL